MSKVRVLATAVLLAVVSGLVVVAQEGPAVLYVVTVDTHGKTAEYVKAMAPLMERTRAMSPGAQTSVYEAVFAGEDAGKVYVALRFPSMAALADFNAKTETDSEFVSRLAAVEATGRTILSRRVLFDRTPR